MLLYYVRLMYFLCFHQAAPQTRLHAPFQQRNHKKSDISKDLDCVRLSFWLENEAMPLLWELPHFSSQHWSKVMQE